MNELKPFPACGEYVLIDGGDEWYNQNRFVITCKNPECTSPSGGGHPQCVAHGRNSSDLMRVRRLTPLECERLQGFPDNYTNVPHKNRPAADAPRYRAIGNSMAVPVMRWIGERIAAVDVR